MPFDGFSVEDITSLEQATHNNIILNTDSYKVSHYKQYPPGTKYVFSYIEARGGEYDSTLFFGLQMFIKKYLMKPINMLDILTARAIWTAHGVPFNEEGWLYILNKHGGYLPVSISAIPEGTLVPVGNALVTIVNTDPACYWLTSYLETALLRAVWYPTTVATRSFRCKRIIKTWLDATSDDTEGQLPFKLHDFGARGVSSFESALIGGTAHLVNFRGTDTSQGLLGACLYYGEPMAGFSIPAAEHSTITSWGRDREADAYANMVSQFAGPGKLVAVVSDSYDIFNAVSNLWGGELKDKVLESGGTVVVRPDSGNPPEVVLECVKRLDATFGSTRNDKGYYVLNPAVRVIQGDGINETTINSILAHLRYAGYAADNVAFGMGGQLLQAMDRDTQKWAMKCSAIYVDGRWQDVFKDPITDQGKRSKRGLLALVEEDGRYKTVRDDGFVRNALLPVYKDGKLLRNDTFATVRERAAAAV